MSRHSKVIARTDITERKTQRQYENITFPRASMGSNNYSHNKEWGILLVLQQQASIVKKKRFTYVTNVNVTTV